MFLRYAQVRPLGMSFTTLCLKACGLGSQFALRGLLIGRKRKGGRLGREPRGFLCLARQAALEVFRLYPA